MCLSVVDLHIDDGSGHGVDGELIFRSARFELYLIDHSAVVLGKLDFKAAYLVGIKVHPCKGYCQRFVLRNIVSVLGNGLNALTVGLDYCSGSSIDLVIVLIARSVELYLVDIDAVVTVKLYLIVPYLACGYTGMVECNALCFVLTDKGLGSCGGFWAWSDCCFPGVRALP